MFRMFQGWLGLSHTAPKEGTLLVSPLLQLATYFLLRPFFDPINPASNLGFLHSDNWKLKTGADMDAALHGATPGNSKELNDEFHPHLNLRDTMVHVPKTAPGDFVDWHCDSRSLTFFSRSTTD